MLTLLFTAPDRRACKVWQGSDCMPYDCGFWFEHASLAVQDIYGLGKVLESLQSQPQVFVIRGQVKEDAPPSIKRRKKEKKGEPAHIESQARPWAMLDADKTSVKFNREDPEASIRELVSSLPEGLKEATCFWHLSSSQHKSETLRCHLWFWLDRPYEDRELKECFKRISGIDPSVCEAVQPHYTADPLFLEGTDPLALRSGFLRGITDIATLHSPGGKRLKELAREKLEKSIREISRVCRTDGARHPVINQHAFYLGQLCPHLLTEAEVFQELFQAATHGSNAMQPDRAADEIRRALDDGKTKPELVGEDWKGKLKFANKGYELAATFANVVIILENDSRWSDALGYDERYNRGLFFRAPKDFDRRGDLYPRALDNEDPARLSCWLQDEYQVNITPEVCGKALNLVCQNSPFDPVKDYLDGLEWDGIPRIDNLPAEIFGDPNQCAKECFARWMISAVKRVYQPGCQADYVLVLEGEKQGERKSSFWQWLAGEWYGLVKSTADSKDSVLEQQGPWIGDLSELASTRRADIEATKNMITTRTDRIRPPYGHVVIETPRRGILGATTNGGPNNPYLNDPTGARRYWIIRVLNRPITLPDPEIRDQLWAESLHRYRSGESSYELSQEADYQLSLMYRERTLESSDPWLDCVREWLLGSSEATISQVLRQACGVGLDRLTPGEERRVAGILRVLGWERVRTVGKTGSGPRVWKAPTDWPKGKTPGLTVVK
jgi:predicted P-loop ATPase